MKERGEKRKEWTGGGGEKETEKVKELTYVEGKVFERKTIEKRVNKLETNKIFSKTGNDGKRRIRKRKGRINGHETEFKDKGETGRK